MISTISFDAVGTLFHTRLPVGEQYARVGGAFGGSLDGKQTDAAFRAAWRAAPPLASGGVSASGEDAERRWWKGVVDATLDRLPEPATSNLARDAYFDSLFESYADPAAWALFPETRATLDKLKRRDFRLGIISNFDSRLPRILEGLGIATEFDWIVHSGAVGVRKPARKIYEVALQGFAAAPENCLHVGDDPHADWRGASDAGMRVFELDRPQNSLTDFCRALFTDTVR